MIKERTIRKREGGTKADAGLSADETRFVLLRHAVQIKADYDGLKGAFATVVKGDEGDGKIIVRIPAEHHLNRGSQDREILLCKGEWELVIGNDYIAHSCRSARTEAGALISRSVSLSGWEREAIAPETAERHAAASLRRERLKIRLRELQRRENERKAWIWAKMGLRAGCSSIVLWTGKEAV